jgi:hypothetical protein
MRGLSALAILAAFGGMPVPAHAGQITFQNELSACLTVKAGKTLATQDIVLAKTTIQLNKPIGECGCKSALASYASSVETGGVQETLQDGLIGLMSGGSKTLVVATQPALVGDKNVTVRLSCAAPL